MPVPIAEQQTAGGGAEVAPAQRRRVIVFHDKCHDGITALWAAKQRWPDAEPYAGVHDVPPDLEILRGADVVLVDFAWKRAAMLDVVAVAESVWVIDHHKTAREDLDGLESHPRIGLDFDMNRSGAGLTWDILVGGTRPWLIDYVEDRDLWRFSLPSCREVHAACNSYPLTLAWRDALMCRTANGLAEEGVAILRYHDRLVESAASNATTLLVGGYCVPAIASPVIEIVSDLGQTLARGAPFSCVYTDRPDGSRLHSLRSAPDGLDVGEIAKLYGGGGHKHAAGFSTPPSGGHVHG